LIDLLPYYAILRSVPNKLVGVVLMLLAIIWLSALIFDTSIIRSNTFKPFNRTLLTIGLFAFITLISLGSKHIEAPYIIVGQLVALVYFGVLLVMVPLAGIFENVFTQTIGSTNISHNK
jgi:quinol-cytochrome oxidoreductase complex cytochrome b subunit